jgi:Domain of unknown function (DUF4431)
VQTKFVLPVMVLLGLACGVSAAEDQALQPTCVDVSQADTRLSLRGTLRQQLFAGPPNFESIANGDEERRTFILELPESICLNDGGDFSDPSERVVTVHVGVGAPEVSPLLMALVDRVIEVEGEAFASHTGHHNAPLVLLADRVSATVQGRPLRAP